MITFELPIVLEAIRRDRVETVEWIDEKVRQALGPEQRHCLEGPVEVTPLFQYYPLKR